MSFTYNRDSQCRAIAKTFLEQSIIFPQTIEVSLQKIIKVVTDLIAKKEQKSNYKSPIDLSQLKTNLKDFVIKKYVKVTYNYLCPIFNIMTDAEIISLPNNAKKDLLDQYFQKLTKRDNLVYIVMKVEDSAKRFIKKNTEIIMI
ncbi:MAG: hypothetical protein BGO10_00300 [Chlamydia sp. 32-24]|nr:MAG: hypothetical protein BGO10_00300 [Chlamydia sp. 32-24]